MPQVGGCDVFLSISATLSSKGYITVLDRNGRRVDGWYRDLRGRNTWHLRDVPARTGIQEILVRSTEGTCGRQPLADNRVSVTVWPFSIPGGQAQDSFDRILAPDELWKPERLPGYTIKYVLVEKKLDNN